MILRHPEDSHVKRIHGMGTLFEVHFSLRSLTAPSWTLQPRQEIMVSPFHNLAYQKKTKRAIIPVWSWDCAVYYGPILIHT